MLLAADDALGNARPRHHFVAIEVAKVEASLQQPAHAHVDLFLGNFACCHRLGQRLVVLSALHIGACQHSLCRCLVGVGGVAVTALLPEVVDGPAVAHHQSLVAPLVAQNLLQQTGVATARLAVPALIGTHHLGHMALLHQCLEGGQVGFPEVAGGKVLHVELMAVPLRSAMNGEVLCTGQRLHVFPTANIVA